MRLNTVKKTHEENLNKKQTQKQAEYLNKQNLKAPKLKNTGSVTPDEAMQGLIYPQLPMVGQHGHVYGEQPDSCLWGGFYDG